MKRKEGDLKRNREAETKRDDLKPKRNDLNNLMEISSTEWGGHPSDKNMFEYSDKLALRFFQYSNRLALRFFGLNLLRKCLSATTKAA